MRVGLSGLIIGGTVTVTVTVCHACWMNCSRVSMGCLCRAVLRQELVWIVNGSEGEERGKAVMDYYLYVLSVRNSVSIL